VTQVDKNNRTVAFAERYSRLAKYFLVFLSDLEPNQKVSILTLYPGITYNALCIFSVTRAIESGHGTLLFSNLAKKD